VSNPAAPVKVSEINLGVWLTCVTVDGQFAYVSGSNKGVFVIDVSDPKAPIMCGNYPQFGFGLTVQGENGHC